MARRSPKSIGTHAESAVIKIVRAYWPDAERLALAGEQDQGDIGHCGPVVFEVKGGHQAWAAQPAMVEKWMVEAERERLHRGVQFGVLVVARQGFGEARARHWWAMLNAAAFADIMGAPGHQNQSIVRLELGALLDILADQGYTVDEPAEAFERDALAAYA